MPQSSEEMYKLINWIIYKKDSADIPDDKDAIKFLESRGYKLTKEWMWEPPKRDHYISEFEILCIRYLIEEWDFGSVKTA